MPDVNPKPPYKVATKVTADVIEWTLNNMDKDGYVHLHIDGYTESGTRYYTIVAVRK